MSEAVTRPESRSKRGQQSSRCAALSYRHIKLIHERPLFIGSIATAVAHCVTLAETQILNPAGELGLLVDQARGGARRAAGEKSGAEGYREDDRCNIHGIFLSSSGVNQMEN